ncbi:MAG: hypothetical protein JXB49_13080 [Bacteroidales bacterium]|nr:hypothetical protein [Bacteroidales bacterium]
MSNLILFKKTKTFDYDIIVKLQTIMRLRETITFNCSGYNLWLFQKINSTDNYNIYREGKNLAVATGTFFYKSYSFKESLNQLYRDFLCERFSITELYGHYAIVIIIDEKINIINDSLGIQRIFSTSDRSVISTSFLATWFSHIKPLSINRNAFFEKISTGYITAPDTLIEGIIDITYDNFNENLLIKHHYPLTNYFSKGKEDIDFQVSKLHEYFEKLFFLAHGHSISLGVSSGFDSRMLLSIIREYSNKYLYTHSTKGVHKKESEIAIKIANMLGDNISIKETTNADNVNLITAEALLTDLFYYFDGRTANNSGAFSYTGTYEYNYHHLKNVYLGLNGKGGEVYRNYYNLPRGRFSFKKWFLMHECYSSFKLVFSREQRNEIVRNIENKILKRLLSEGRKWDRWLIQRYYSEIRQPDCEASIINAHNKITRYVAPFLDGNLLRDAYKSFDSKGVSDRFQSRLIYRLSPELAGIKSKYGYDFKNKSIRWRFIEWIKRNEPFWFKSKRFIYDLKKTKSIIGSNIHTKSAIGVLDPIFPEINWGNAIIHYAQRNVVIYLAKLIREGRKYNKLN